MLSALTSKKVTLFLLGALAITLAPATVSKTPIFIGAGRLLITLLAIHLSLCTITRWRRLSADVLLIHTGVLIILLGSMISRAGYIATINIYEGDSSDSAFRWDRQEDTPLGFTLTLNAIHHDLYPVAVRVGVLIKNKPSKLYELKTGESFSHEGFHVEALAFDPIPPSLQLVITEPNGHRSVKSADKEAPAQLGEITLQLIAFQTPKIKRSWVDLTLTPAIGLPSSGKAEVNSPLQWHGLRFYHTSTNTDPLGKPYAGIQIVNDQGIPLVYLGFIALCLGNSIFFFKKWPGLKPTSRQHTARP
ncbi:MAG: hypothetical protein PHI06_05295 [Desulfobulbaceae bacterium]|nr:hypothetical protein [Desulfobulbaceae bacterium]